MVGILSDVGNFRKLNEDSIGYYENDNKRIYVIADGMGGHNAGEVASKIAVESTIKYINSLYELNDIEKILIDAIDCSNSEIYEMSMCNNELNGMGTTITACLIKGMDMVVANVGDSSCYIIKDNKINKVTKDHSLVQQLIDEGSITENEAVRHPNKNIITRALGTSMSVIVDTFKINLKGVSKIILCTDGLTNEVSADEIYDIITQNNNDNACKKLVELSKLRGGRDNISVMVFEGECENDRNNTGK